MVICEQSTVVSPMLELFTITPEWHLSPDRREITDDALDFRKGGR
jgi:hypothetical protein